MTFLPTSLNVSASQLRKAANALRFLAMDAVQKANSGHPGMPMGMADIATVLWGGFLRHNPTNPAWFDRDRFVLSNGHGCMLLYGLLHLSGYDLPLEALQQFRQWGSQTPGHPEYGHTPGVEVTTGPLGQGIANAVGFALAERWLAQRFNRDAHEIINHRTYVFLGDGCLMEGLSHEACSLAGHLKLGRLIALYDDNHISIDGPTELSFSENVPQRFSSYGWKTQQLDGHDPVAIKAALENAQRDQSAPHLLCCKTTIGWGAPSKAGQASTHGSPLGDEEIAATRQKLNWHHPPFELPPEVKEFWQVSLKKGQQLEADWNQQLSAYQQQFPSEATELKRIIKGKPSQQWQQPLENLLLQWKTQPPAENATRAHSGAVLNTIVPCHTDLLGGSADLTPSNNTRTNHHTDISPLQWQGNYIRYGVREHAMGAIMNGLARHGGCLPYGATFLTFSDYMRPAIRMAAIMKIQVIYVFTHDSIGLGEDGPTHQPIEHLASLRAIPNLRVLRPADARETAQCWQLALQYQGPSLLALSRQKIPHLPGSQQYLCHQGAYIISSSKQTPKAILMASGTEVQIAIQAQTLLEQQNIPTRVISMPCWELLTTQHHSLLSLPEPVVKLAIEAASPFGWHQWLGEQGIALGMQSFGASAPADKLYTQFNLTPQAIVKEVQTRCKLNT